MLIDVLKENNTKISSVVLASALDSVPLNEKGNQESYTKGIQFAGLEDLRKRIDVNITSQLFIIKSIYKYLDINSHILLFSSIYGVRSPDHRIYQKNFIKPLEYTTSKSAIIGLTKHLSVTLALEKKGRANCLILGGLRNETQDENFQANYIDKVPLKRMLEKEDILNIYDFLNSDKSSYITGSSIAVDGGYTAW